MATASAHNQEVGDMPHNARFTLQLAQIVSATEAEGPGRRFAIWFQGCPLRCPGCCNPEMLPFEGGQAVPLDDLLEQIDSARQQADLEGITLLGGEPFAHAEGAAVLASKVQQRDLSVIIFSGFTLEELRRRPEASVGQLLRNTDILVDGPYLREEPETQRRWIGSSNQRIHFLTDRYQADDPRWKRPNTLEIRLVDGALSVNGFPAQHAAGLWKQITSKTRDERS